MTSSLTVITIDSRAVRSDTRGVLSGTLQNPICSKCVGDNGGCESAAECVCKQGYFGRVCDKKVHQMSDDSLAQTRVLGQFETLHFEETYEKGEKETQFEIRAKNSPLALLLANTNGEQDRALMFREDRGKRSSTLKIESWDNGSKFYSLVVNDHWLGVTLMNLSPTPVEFELKMTRVRSNVFNVVSLVLYILMVAAIALLLVLSICVACLKGTLRSAGRKSRQVDPRHAGQIANSEEEPKLDEKDVEKYLPLIPSEGRPQASER